MNGPNRFLAIPTELLYKIFGLCDVQDQLKLAKTCQHFKKIIEKMFEKRFKFMIYDCCDLKGTFNLYDREIIELCQLSGRHVERMRCNVTFETAYSYISDNEKKTIFYNVENFCKNIRYFYNLKEIEIKGNTYLDKIVSELSVHCRKLESIKFWDYEEYRFHGTDLEKLENIVNVDVKRCRALKFVSLLNLSQKRHLKSLNVLECTSLYKVPFCIQLCNHWLHLETLILFAFTTEHNFYKALINLPSLKFLKLSFECQNYGFIENFFLALQQNTRKSLLLKHLKYAIENLYWTSDINEIPSLLKHRFGKTVDTTVQYKNQDFKNICLAQGNFKNLNSLVFQYCRPFNNNQLKHFAMVHEHLERIKIIDFPLANDEAFKTEWSCQNPAVKSQLELENRWYTPLKKIEPPITSRFQIRLRVVQPSIIEGPISQCSQVWSVSCEFCLKKF